MSIPPRRLTPELLTYGIRTASAPALSPDGVQVVFTLHDVDPTERQRRSRLWTCRVDGADLRPLTSLVGVDGGAVWSPDGSAIAVVADASGVPGIWVLRWNDSGGGSGSASVEPRLLLEASQVDDLRWSPDGRHLCCVGVALGEVPPGPPAEPPVQVATEPGYLADGVGFVGSVRRQTWVVPVEGGAPRRVTGGDRCDAPRWSPDGRRIAVVRHDQQIPVIGARGRLELVDLDHGPALELGMFGRLASGLSWSPHAELVCFAATPGPDTEQPELFVAGPSDGLRRVTDGLEVLPDGDPVWIGPGTVLVHAVERATSGLYEVNLATGSVRRRVEFSGALHSGCSVDDGVVRMAQTRAEPDRVGEFGQGDVVVVQLGGGDVEIITDLNSRLVAAVAPARPTAGRIRRDGVDIDHWLLRPPGLDEGVAHPLVIDVHGGPHTFVGHDFQALHQCLVSHGFLVACANPRGSASYGRAFVDAVLGDWGGEDLADLMAVTDALAALPFVDERRIGIMGFSYGGFLVGSAIGRSDRFAAAVCGEPVIDLTSFHGTSDIGHTYGQVEFGGAPEDRPEWYRERSPLTRARHVTTPTLLLHGDADRRCPIGQSEQFHSALHRAGCEVELRRYPGGDHWWAWLTGSLEQREDVLAATLGWFQRHLQGPADAGGR